MDPNQTNPIPSKPEFMTVEQVAELMQVRDTTVRLWLQRKILKGLKIGHSWRIPRKSLDEFTGFQ
jgi:excisionase family DNA binding protein